MGLDENLPSFHITDSKTSESKTEIPYLLTRGGNEPEPAYTLKRPDPASPTSQNCYAAALFDAYNPDILYGEVLIRPRWTQPSLSAEDIRRNGGVPPPPEPILPVCFTVQLYNPDLQIEVQREQSTFGGTHYDFAMPQDTFRLPSSSALDRQQHDPAANLTTPKICFSFKRESKLSKEMALHMTGRSTDVVHKKRSKEPDISIALFKALRELTVYEPNLYRLEMEDPKGLEVTILLVATVVKDVYYNNLRAAFNVTDPSAGRRRSSGGSLSPTAAGRKASDPSNVLRKDPRPNDLRKQPSAMMSGGLSPPPSSNIYQRPNASTSHLPDRTRPAEPITDPRTQWAIDAETARLKQQADEEARRAGAERRERARREDAESKRLMKQLESEEKERRRKEREVEKETERLRRIYGDQGGLSGPARQNGAASAPVAQGPFPQPNMNGQRPPPQQQQRRSQPVYAKPSYPQHPQPGPSRPQQPAQAAQHAGIAGLYPASGGSGAFNAGASMSNLLGIGKGGKLKAKRSSLW